MNEINNFAELRSHYKDVDPLALAKVQSKLDQYCRQFISISPFLVLATSAADGTTDASPRGDAPGFVAILDDHTLLLPDRPGNRRVDSFHNVLSSPGVGLLFFVSGLPETPRVNGIALLITDVEMLKPSAVQGKQPISGLLIEVTEAFFHCGKALIRSRLWDKEIQTPRSSFPSLGQILADQTHAMEGKEADVFVERAYRTTLY